MTETKRTGADRPGEAEAVEAALVGLTARYPHMNPSPVAAAAVAAAYPVIAAAVARDQAEKDAAMIEAMDIRNPGGGNLDCAPNIRARAARLIREAASR